MCFHARLAAQMRLERYAKSDRSVDPFAVCRNLWTQVDTDEDVQLPCASEMTSLVGGTGKLSALAAMPAACILVARDRAGARLWIGGTPWRVSITGPGRALITIIDHHDGTHSVVYTCATSGTYRLVVRIGQRKVYDGRVFVFDAHGAPTIAVVRHTYGIGESGKHSEHSLFARWVVWSSLRALQLTIGMELRAKALGFHQHWRARDVLVEMGRYCMLRKLSKATRVHQMRQVRRSKVIAGGATLPSELRVGPEPSVRWWRVRCETCSIPPASTAHGHGVASGPTSRRNPTMEQSLQSVRRWPPSLFVAQVRDRYETASAARGLRGRDSSRRRAPHDLRAA